MRISLLKKSEQSEPLTTTTSTATATTPPTTSPSRILCKSDYKWNSLANVNFQGNKKEEKEIK